MGQEVTTFVPILTIFPWSDTDAPDPSRRGVRPLGALTSVVRDGAIAIPAAGDNQILRCDTLLPSNFQWLLLDFYISMGGAGLATTGNWENLGNFTFFDTVGGVGGGQSFEAGMGVTSRGPAGQDNTWQQNWCVDCPLPKFLQVGGGTWQLRLTNLTNDDIAATFNYVARFLQFTVDQEFDAGVNTPSLVR